VRKLHRDGVKNRKKRGNAAVGRAIHLQYTLELPEWAELAARHLQLFDETFARVLADENFLTLLRAELMPTIPAYLTRVLDDSDITAKSINQNGRNRVEASHPARRPHCFRISDQRLKTLCFNQLNVTICCRYIESLVKAPRIKRYLAKHHPAELGSLQSLLAEFEQTCQIVNPNYDTQ